MRVAEHELVASLQKWAYHGKVRIEYDQSIRVEKWACRALFFLFFMLTLQYSKKKKRVSSQIY